MSNETTKPKMEIEKIGNALASKDNGEFALYLDANKFDQAWRVANHFAKSDLVPEHYRNKPENCMLAFIMATRLGIDPLMLMQKTYIIKGRAGMEAQLAIALVNARGPFEGPIDWKFTGFGKDLACTAFATHEKTGQKCTATISWKMVELEGWDKKPGSKWLTIPEQMFKYRSAVFLARLYCPEVLHGFETVDEIQDTYEKEENESQLSPLEQKLYKNPVKQVENEAKKEPEPEQAKTLEPPEHIECRFLCQECSHEADKFGFTKKGGKFDKWKCPSCLSTNVLDRRPEEGYPQ